MTEPLIIQKYGGTSLGTSQRLNMVSDIIETYKNKNKLVIVVSAISSINKSLGTTSKLLSIIESTDINSIDSIELDHLQLVNEIISDTFQVEQVTKIIKSECLNLKSFMTALDIIGEVSPRSKDVIISVGEKLSAILLTAVLNSKGISAEYINLENVVNTQFSELLDQTFYDYISLTFSNKLNSVIKNNKIPVVTGFFGKVPGSIIKAIGRGYTDLTAALIAVGLNADELQIWKEVDGVFTTDPRKVGNARLLSFITPEEAAELTYYGSEVIHPFTMEQVINAKIPIRIKNVLNASVEGTFISKQITSKIPGPTAVTIKSPVIVLNIHSNGCYGFFSHIFQILNEQNIIIDLVSTSHVHVSVVLNNVISQNIIDKLNEFGTVTIKENMAILSLIGTQMRKSIGIASKLFNVLAENNINIEMISQGSSEINISCVISLEKSELARKVAHSLIIN